MAEVSNSRLRQERLLRGLSQKDVADHVKTDKGTIGRWERGETTPSPYYRQKLCQLFGKNAEELGFIDSREVPSSEEVAAPEDQRGPAKQDSIPEQPKTEINAQSNKLPQDNLHRLTRKLVFLICLIAVLVFTTFLASYFFRYYNALDASEPPEIIYQKIMERNATWSDSMFRPNSDFLWDQGTGCGYNQGAYHTDIAIPGGVKECIAQNMDLQKNFAFQIQMSILQGNLASGDGGELLFCDSGSESYYRLRIGADGSYDLIAVREGLANRTLSPYVTNISIKEGLRLKTVVTVVILDGNIFLYVNGKVLRSRIRDNTSTVGRIGVQFDGNPTSVVFSQAKVWILDSKSSLSWF